MSTCLLCNGEGWQMKKGKAVRCSCKKRGDVLSIPDFPAPRSAVHQTERTSDFPPGLSPRDDDGIRQSAAQSSQHGSKMPDSEEKTGP
jgi:hypothetical protein